MHTWHILGLSQPEESLQLGVELYKIVSSKLFREKESFNGEFSVSGSLERVGLETNKTMIRSASQQATFILSRLGILRSIFTRTKFVV